MPQVDGPKLIEILWNDAFRTVVGSEYQGEPVDPEEVWTCLHQRLEELGLEFDVRAKGEPGTAWPTEIDGIPVGKLVRLASGYEGKD